MSDPLLELRHISRTFGGGGGPFKQRVVVALKDFSLAIDAATPSITAIVGESGSGKTTMARIALGLDEPTGGEVLYAGQPLRKLSRAQRREFRRGVQAILQDPFGTYNSFYKVDHVLTSPLKKFGLAKTPTQQRELMEAALVAVGLKPEETLGRYPHQLSGGQRQRLMVARTLVLRPRVIVADEPVSMIDASLRATVLANLLQLKHEYGISLIYITHDLTTAHAISDHIIVLYRGEVVEEGPPDQVIERPQHPYTQLLIDSIPEPDPEHAWGDAALFAGEDEEEVIAPLQSSVKGPELAMSTSEGNARGNGGGRDQA